MIKDQIKDALNTDSINYEELTAMAIKGAALVAGAAAAIEIFKHRRLLSVVAVGAASAMCVKRYLDKHPDAFSCSKSAKRTRLTSDMGSASYKSGDSVPSSQSPQDPIDEAMMESFPASDPPASYRRA